MKPLNIHATWDEEARVWVATSEDVPGLATEAETSEELIEKLKILIPELLEANSILEGDTHTEIPFHLVSEREAKASLQMADFTRELKKLLNDAGCYFERQGRGDHEIWYSPMTDRRFVVDQKIKSRHTANAVLKQAGLPKAF